MGYIEFALICAAGAPGFSVDGGVTKCPAGLALRMIELGATIVHVSEAINEAETGALVRAVAASSTLVRLTVTGTVPPDGIARIAAAALTVRGLTFVRLPGAGALVSYAGARVRVELAACGMSGGVWLGACAIVRARGRVVLCVHRGGGGGGGGAPIGGWAFE